MTENARYYFDAERFPQGIDWPREQAQLSPGLIRYVAGKSRAPITAYWDTMKALAQDMPGTDTWNIAMQRLANIA